eukprot:15436480-Heterocapsa_arctica.AAC.1
MSSFLDLDCHERMPERVLVGALHQWRNIAHYLMMSIMLQAHPGAQLLVAWALRMSAASTQTTTPAWTATPIASAASRTRP